MSKLVLKIYKKHRRSGAGAPALTEDAPPKPAPAASPPPEHRSTAREDRVHKITYKVLIPMQGEGFTQDASRDGFCVFLDKQVPPGAVMEMKFPELNSGESRPHSIGKVVWRKDHMAGIKVLRK